VKNPYFNLRLRPVTIFAVISNTPITSEFPYLCVCDGNSSDFSIFGLYAVRTGVQYGATTPGPDLPKGKETFSSGP
jgi:hypothetical protein